MYLIRLSFFSYSSQIICEESVEALSEMIKIKFLKLLELADIGTQQIFNIQRKALGLD